MLFVIHSGQTGVERGAHAAARACQVGVAGFMPSHRRDELGRIPPHVAEFLLPCAERGPRCALRASFEIASAALIVVPDARSARHVSGLLWVLQRTRAKRLWTLIADGETSHRAAAIWASSLTPTCGSVRLLVTGPRATRWVGGEQVARSLVRSIASVISTPLSTYAPSEIVPVRPLQAHPASVEDW